MGGDAIKGILNHHRFIRMYVSMCTDRHYGGRVDGSNHPAGNTGCSAMHFGIWPLCLHERTQRVLVGLMVFCMVLLSVDIVCPTCVSDERDLWVS